MFKKIDEINRIGNKALEDTCYSTNSFSFVLDGASSLIKKRITKYDSDPQWLALRFKEEIKKLESIDNPKQTCHQIMNLLKNEFDGLSEYDNNDDLYPSAGLSLVYEKYNKINIFQLGDCSILVKFKDGSVREYANHTITKLDNIVIEKMVEISKTEKINVQDAREKVTDILIAHRKLKNKESGYMILDPTGVGINNADEFVLDKNYVDSILIMSDGFRACIDTFSIYNDNKSFFRDCEDNGLSYVCDKLFKLQDDDKTLNKFPRLKKRDDTTAILLKIKI